MCIGEKAQPTTSKSKCFAKALLVLMIPQIAATVIAFIANEQFLKEGIISIFFLLLLFFGYYKLSYQAMMIYVFMALFFFVTFLVYILTLVQNGKNFGNLQDNESRAFSIAIASCAFYLFIAIFVFFPYRQFKALEYAQNPALAEFMQHQSQLNEKNEKMKSEQQLKQKQSGQNQKKYTNGTYFKGKSVMIG